MIAGVVVTHAAPAAQLERCLGALLADGSLDRIIVIDNGGSAVVPAVSDRLDLVRTDNRGYGAAANDGFALAATFGADHIALLNDDVIVRPGWTVPIVDALASDDRLGAAQPKLLFADREPSTINSLGVSTDRFGAGHDLGFDEPDRDVASSEIEAFTGGAVLFRREFLDDTGGFDERYFLYYEDVDLAARGRAFGWRYRCVPDSVVDHIGSATTSGDPNRTRYLQERNRLWWTARNADTRTMARAMWLSFRRLRHEPRAVHLRALIAGLTGMPSRRWERHRSG